MDCSAIAKWYAPAEYLCFGQALQRRRTAFLSQVQDARRAILAGDGDGRFLAALVASNENVRVDSVEACPAMSRLAEARVSKMGIDVRSRVEFLDNSICQFAPRTAPYDLIATHFFLDCFSTAEVNAMVSRIAAWATPQARWILSEFRQLSHPVSRLWSRAFIRSLYFAFGITTNLRITELPDYRPALSAAGFELRQEKQSWGGLLVSELWERKPRAV